jgi:hypothetical protein
MMHGILSKKVVEIIIKGGQDKAYSTSPDKTAWSICHFFGSTHYIQFKYVSCKGRRKKRTKHEQEFPQSYCTVHTLQPRQVTW